MPKVTKYLGYFCKKICYQELSKVVQSCHAVPWLFSLILSLQCDNNIVGSKIVKGIDKEATTTLSVAGRKQVTNLWKNCATSNAY